MEIIEVKCCVCSTKFERAAKEVRRNAKLGRRVYCSRQCCGRDNLDNIPEDKRSHPENLDPLNKLDEFSPFRWHLRNIKQHCKKRKQLREVTINLKDLKGQWEKQEGRCPYTGWQLKNMPTTSYRYQLPLTRDRASVDRIDSSKGYTPDNIQFVSYMAQCAKHKFDESDLEVFCEAVVEQRDVKARDHGSSLAFRVTQRST